MRGGTSDKKLQQMGQAVEAAISENPKQAELHADQVVKSVELLCQRGSALEQEKKYQEAILEYDKALDIASGFAPAYLHKGFSHSALRQNQAFIDSCSRAIELDPGLASANIHLRMGCAFAELGQHEKAILEYNKAIGFDSAFAKAHFYKSLALSQLGKDEEAAIEMSEATELNPIYASGEYYLERGNRLYGLKRYAEAEAEYSKAIEIDPDYAMPYQNRGVVLYDLGRYDESIASYKQAFAKQAGLPENHPSIANTYLGLGKVYLALGNKAEAAKYLAEVDVIMQHPCAAPEVNIKAILAALIGLKVSIGELPQAEPVASMGSVAAEEE